MRKRIWRHYLSAGRYEARPYFTPSTFLSADGRTYWTARRNLKRLLAGK